MMKNKEGNVRPMFLVWGSLFWFQVYHTKMMQSYAFSFLPSHVHVPISSTLQQDCTYKCTSWFHTSTYFERNALNEPTNMINYSTLTSTSTSTSTSLQASRNNKGYNYNNAFKTARESAVIVEWEPISELERRIDEGMHYQHYIEDEFDTASSTSKPHSNGYRTTHETQDSDNIERVKGIFCGCKVTQEEISRLKSANPDEPTP